MWFHISRLLNSQTALLFSLRFFTLDPQENKSQGTKRTALSLLCSHRSAVLFCRGSLWTIACECAFMD